MFFEISANTQQCISTAWHQHVLSRLFLNKACQPILSHLFQAWRYPSEDIPQCCSGATTHNTSVSDVLRSTHGDNLRMSSLAYSWPWCLYGELALNTPCPLILAGAHCICKIDMPIKDRGIMWSNRVDIKHLVPFLTLAVVCCMT